MGQALSEEYTHSAHIDKEIKSDEERLKRTVFLLLIGAQGAGKSTFVKQLRIWGNSDFTAEELSHLKSIIYQNIVDCIHTIIDACNSLGLCVQESNEDASRSLYHIRSKDLFEQSRRVELRAVIQQWWLDPSVQQCCKARSLEFNLPEYASYFLSDVERILADEYIPTKQDSLYSREETNGVHEVEIRPEVLNKLWLRVIDVGGQKAERRKWFHHFERVNSVVFVASVSGYDKTISEDGETSNELLLAMQLFGQIIHNPVLAGKPILLFLNKMDLLTHERLKRSRIKNHFPEYQGSQSDVYCVCIFLKKQFMSRVKEADHLSKSIDPILDNRSENLAPREAKSTEGLNEATSSDPRLANFFCHFTRATDMKQTSKLFQDVAHVLVGQNLSKLGMI